MWSLGAFVFSLCCYGTLSTAFRPRFRSTNFHNVLEWDPVKPVQPGGEPVLYSVMYRSFSSRNFRPKPACQNITFLSCDLTVETPSLPDVHYVAKLYADGRFVNTSYRFKPIKETVLTAPEVSRRIVASSLHLDITLPLCPNGTSMLDIFNRTRRVTLNPLVEYTINITHPLWAGQTIKNTSGHFVLNLKNNNTEYCGVGIYRPNFEIGRSWSKEASFCITLSGNRWMFTPWFLLVAALLLLLVIVSAFCIYLYVDSWKKTSFPASLQGISFTALPHLQLPPENFLISRLEMGPANPLHLEPGGYSPQGAPGDQLDRDSSSSCVSSDRSDPQGSAAQLSVSYVSVGMSCMEAGTSPAVRLGDQGTVGFPWGSSTRVRDWGVDRAKPLMLQTVRNAGGELTLPFLMLEPRTDGETPETRSLLTLLYLTQGPPRRLLSLHSHGGSEDGDSGCDQSTGTTPKQHSLTSDDSPTRFVPLAFPGGRWGSDQNQETGTSGYKQNWMPESTGFKMAERRRGCKMSHRHWTPPEDTGEEEEQAYGEEEDQVDEQIFLGGWVVQIQE